ncbi:globin domain-containing protein [Streptomyces ovatisporus]|uniref:nitric oxide dioxygenase n=1 Tax=Streptomyces ovatisporus TaxID=1128682 RepID=A0ABV9AD15_9ACTN
MTTTSAGNGPSAGDGGRGDGGRDDGDWGWFSPATPQAAGPTAEHRTARHEEDEPTGTNPWERARGDEARGTPEARTTPEQAPREPERPSLRPVGPVAANAGPGAIRTRLAAAPEQPESADGGGSRGFGDFGRGRPAPAIDVPTLDVPTVDAGLELAREHPCPAAPPHGQHSPHGRGVQPPPYAAPPAAAPPETDPVGTRDATLIRRTMEEVEPVADAATAYFYALLFVEHPELRELFPASMDTQRDRLFRALLTAVRLAEDTDVLTRYLSGLGRGHRKYGTRPEHYPAVGECLLGALAQYTPNTWSQETEDAWVRAYTLISQVMIDAAAEDEMRAPAWWNAQIVSHELRTPDIAVITLRTDQPYPFRAGQYTSVETPWWPRVWRHYSFASSPRPDGLLTFHVKAVPTGWVSNALVHRARPGDVLRLGPSSGGMTVDHSTDNGLLCLGGGTGIAPIKAMVEDVVQQGRRRPVEVFYGARSDHDLYDLETMLRLEQRHDWLSVRPVAVNGPGPSHANVLSGQLPDAVKQYGPWSSYVGYLSGPPGMIRSGLDALVAAGVPAHRIRHDAVAELNVGSD